MNNLPHNIFWSAIRVWVNRLSGIIIFFILARILTPKDFGVYSTIWAIMLFCEVLTEQGFGEGIIQRQTLTDKLLNTAFAVNLLISIAIVILIFLLSPLMADYMKMPELVWPLKVASLSLIVNSLGFGQLALYRRNFKFKWLAIRTLFATIISGGVGVLLALKGFGYWALVFQYLVSSLTNLTFLWIRPIWIPSASFSLEEVRELFRYSSKLMTSKLLEASNTRIFELYIASLVGAISFGFYSLGARIYSICMQLLSICVIDVTHAQFSRQLNDKLQLEDSYFKALNLCLFISVPIFLLVSLSSESICVVLFGAKWLGSTQILSIFAILGAFHSVEYINGSVLTASGKTGKLLVLSIFKVLMMFCSLFLLQTKEITQIAFFYCISQIVFIPALSFIYSKAVVLFTWNSLVAKTYRQILMSLVSYCSTYFFCKFYLKLEPGLFALTLETAVFLAIQTLQIKFFFPNLFEIALNLLLKRLR